MKIISFIYKIFNYFVLNSSKSLIQRLLLVNVFGSAIVITRDWIFRHLPFCYFNRYNVLNKFSIRITRFSDDDHKNLIAQITDIFGKRLVPYASQLFMDKITLSYLWSKGQQIFIYYRDERARMQNPVLWPSRCLPNPWPNTMSCQTLFNFLNQNISDRPLNSMFVSQGILTPSNTYVKLHFFSTLERDLSLTCNRSLLEWLKLKSSGPKGPNIVMSDFIECNNFEIPILTVQLNKLLNDDKK
jgi:hypothetical protein